MTRPERDQDLGVLIEVARMYYEQGLTQVEIGRVLNTSRSTVSRLLQDARDHGVVTITINYGWACDAHLEDELRLRYRLKDVSVLRSFNRPTDEIHQGLGQLAAQALHRYLQPGMVLGISYGRSMAATIKNLTPTRKEEVTVVQIIGALGSRNPLIDGVDLARELANKLEARYRYLHAPLIVEDRRTRDLLMQEPAVHEVLTLGRRSNIILIGIGALAADASGLIWTGYISEKELQWLRNKGAVGHMCAQFFDSQGRILDVDFNHRSISIGLQTLPSIETVIAVAGTRQKAAAILGALRGGYVDVLITDDQAAAELLKLADRE